MNKPLLLGAAIIIIILAGIVLWKWSSTELVSSPSPVFEEIGEAVEAPAAEVPSEALPQVGVDDIAAQADSEAKLDKTIDADIGALDAELRGL